MKNRATFTVHTIIHNFISIDVSAKCELTESFFPSIFPVGGFDGSTGLNSAEVLDLSAGEAASARSFQSLGGPSSASGPLALPSVARAREWRPIANMSTRRSSVGVGVLGGLIYAVGGYDGNSRHCLSSVEVYCPEQDVWKPVADMSAR